MYDRLMLIIHMCREGSSDNKHCVYIFNIQLELIGLKTSIELYKFLLCIKSINFNEDVCADEVV